MFAVSKFSPASSTPSTPLWSSSFQTWSERIQNRDSSSFDKYPKNPDFIAKTQPNKEKRDQDSLLWEDLSNQKRGFLRLFLKESIKNVNINECYLA